MRRLESAQGKLIKQSLGLIKLSHNTALLKALNIEKIEDIVNRNGKSSASTDAALIVSFYMLW